MRKSIRRRIAGIINLIIISPILPLVVIVIVCEAIARGINWCMDGRWLTLKLGAITERVEVWFGVDADTDYKEWQERMRKQRILSTKKTIV
jgi:hypothetical protein